MKTKQHSIRSVLGKLFLCILSAQLTACGNKNRVTMSTNDPTPPNIHWDITNPDTGQHDLVTDDAQQRVIEEEKVFTTLCMADDPEGIKKVSVKISALLFCQRNTENPSSADYYRHKKKIHEVLMNKDYEADENKTVPNSGFIMTDLNGEKWKGIDCKNGYTSSAVQGYTIQCTAWNWSNQSTARSLQIKNADIFQ